MRTLDHKLDSRPPVSANPFAAILADLERAAPALPGGDMERHRRVLRAAANVVQAARSAAAANDFPGGAGLDEVLAHLADNLEAFDAAVGDG